MLVDQKKGLPSLNCQVQVIAKVRAFWDTMAVSSLRAFIVIIVIVVIIIIIIISYYYYYYYYCIIVTLVILLVTSSSVYEASIKVTNPLVRRIVELKSTSLQIPQKFEHCKSAHENKKPTVQVRGWSR